MIQSDPVGIRPLHVGKFLPPPYAGVEEHIDALLKCLSPEVQATLVAAQSPGGKSRSDYPYKVVLARNYGKLYSATVSPGILNIVRKEIGANRSNVLHLHAPNPWADFSAILKPAGIPSVMTWHSDIVRQRSLMLFYRGVQKKALSSIDRLVLFTPGHLEASRQIPSQVRGRVRFIPLGLDADSVAYGARSDEMYRKIKEFGDGGVVFLAVGRHVYYKGYEYLLEAFSKIPDKSSVLVMVGAGVLSSKLMKLASQLKVNHRVLFLGEVEREELLAALHASDVFCMPSVLPSEAFGIASAEAMSCGKPTIVCELGNGVNYLNRHNVTGLTVPPRDSSALALAMTELMVDHRKRVEFGANAYNWIREEFSLERMKNETITMYKELV